MPAWFRAKSAFLTVGEIIAFFADFVFVFAKMKLVNGTATSIRWQQYDRMMGTSQ